MLRHQKQSRLSTIISLQRYTAAVYLVQGHVDGRSADSIGSQIAINDMAGLRVCRLMVNVG